MAQILDKEGLLSKLLKMKHEICMLASVPPPRKKPFKIVPRHVPHSPGNGANLLNTTQAAIVASHKRPLQSIGSQSVFARHKQCYNVSDRFHSHLSRYK